MCLRLRSGTVQTAPKIETTRCLSEVEGTIHDKLFILCYYKLKITNYEQFP